MNSIIPRNFDGEFGGVPRHWLANNAAATAIANGVNLLFPHGERVFVRSVKHYLEQIKDPELRAAIRGFFGQEGRHAHAHDRYNEVLRAQGYDVDSFLDRFTQLADWLEARTPPALRLAFTAACEHFTAIMAEGAFTEGGMLERAVPEMQQLLAWHAAEEIEHRAVAFDVLRTVNPSYLLRVAGLLYAAVMLGGGWLWGASSLLRQEKLGVLGLWREFRKVRQDSVARRVFLRGILQYLRRDFHPNQHATDHLASAWMTAHGISLPGTVTEAA